MLKSMTGFGRVSDENDDISISIELRTVNHKYLDFQLRIPQILNYLQDGLIAKAKEYIKRGRVELFIKLEKKDSLTEEISINYELAKELYQKIQALKEILQVDDEIHLHDILEYPGVFEKVNRDPQEDTTMIFVLALFEKALQELTAMRLIEGEKLKKDLTEKLEEMVTHLQVIEGRRGYVTQNYRERLEKKIHELMVVDDKDRDRLQLEIALFAEKSDINEECVRLRSHIHQYYQTMEMNDAIGRKLDFITQEMNREVNTICSKSNDEVITKCGIEMKSLIEKLREQAQNVE